MANTLTKTGSIADIASSIIDDSIDGIEAVDIVKNEKARENECVQESKSCDAANVEFGASVGSAINNVHDKEGWKKNKRKFSNLLNEEISIREAYAKKPAAQGKGGVINVVLGSILNMISAFLIFVFFLISLESLFSIGLSVSLTVYAYNIARNDPTFEGNMSWTLLTFAVITPLTTSIGMAFKRRESALVQIADFKVTMANLLSAHVFWDWCKIGSKPSGRAACNVDWLQHTDEVLYSMIRICCELTRLLTLPNANRARHHVLPYGRKQHEDVATVSRKLHRSILEDMAIITEKCEVLKFQGLPPNEATRIRQWERFLSQEMEHMIVIKKYRTPQALRSFARLFTVFLPPFYAPYYGQLANDLHSLGLAITFSIITSVALTALFESMSQLEDPFLGSRLDCIDVELELRDEFLVKLLDIRDHRYPDADPFELTGIQFPIKTTTGPEIRFLQAY
mmetsp:Transcript_47686/g.55751  ORF Transcript_47686/g.55751 Transcript_47686/m.55751 type:complete len:454 (-) Transcript_47686:69-1430(-)|eukprot:CAMPEP_0194359556 /NCGR_PEP_ID=MMETSP0174-20130528/6810_1 /TAXON_ID=216777 /ORGANISM="Proboscia alata, Strain PI-D3" /LENGTH=453 /DNA_ID=CAMNT_0039130507 /DNA_START=34 /DNA_END=1395 /DNA_ORIENTATION=+